jgi:hypothetical protein
MKKPLPGSIGAAFGLAAIVLLAAGAARSQSVDPSLDHLQCYRIRDTLAPTRYVADLRNQFGLAPGCQIAVPARLLCAETEKRITSLPLPPGGGPAGAQAGHFLCYSARCPDDVPLTTMVEDQFGRRPIVHDRTRLVCAPVNKLICGDGEIDPGEQCDPGSATTNTCPGDQTCRADCTCAQDCPCGADCADDDGNLGQCRLASSAANDCECKVPPPPECPCDATCTDPASGAVGRCEPVAGTNFCDCRVPPPECPCGDECTTANGLLGRCRDVAGTNVCECVADPPPECPCNATCERNGEAGICRALPGLPPGVCDCFIPPPPPECPCNARCERNGRTGICRALPGLPPGVCDCFIPPPPPECPCGKDCTTAAGVQGRCRPQADGSGACSCVARN